MQEPMYDDATLEWLAEEQSKDLVGQLWQYILTLEDYAIRLRKQVNCLSEEQHKAIPFPDPASDFVIRFYDHPLFSEFSEQLIDAEADCKIPN